MKLKTYFSLTHWISFLRRQPKHIQHIYAFVFSGTITFVIAGFILYTDYGFWHEKYKRIDTNNATTTENVSVNPASSLADFFSEVNKQLNDLKVSKPAFLEGKETYTK